MVINMSEPISLFINEGKAHVWLAEDACRLREDHRIVGNLVGSLPRLPRQNVQLGLPLQLLPEEVTLLRDKGLVRLLDGSAPATLPTESEVAEFKEKRQNLYLKQVELCREEAKKRFLQKLPEILEGQRKKKQKRQKKAQTSAEDQATSEGEISVENFDVEKIKIPTLPEKHSCVQICTACPRLKEYPEAKWEFPQTETETLRYRVFRDLWEKGHWLTSGGKFGGDFLIYLGEPARFHSTYIAICRPTSQPLGVQDLMTYSRLGTNVKKTILICSSESEGGITYTAVEWAGLT